MKTNDFLYLALLHRTLDYEKDPNPDNWITIKGTHTHLENGKINGGAGGKFNGRGYTGTKKQAHAGKYNGANTQTENKADLEKRLKELKSKSDSLYWTVTRSDSANKTTSAGKELAKVGAEIKEIEKKLGKRKEFHELTKEQARRAHGMPENKHKERVEKALKEGKTVPENVLADYPDLKEKYGKKEPKKQAGTSTVLSNASMEKVTQAFYKAYQNEKDEKVKQELKMWHDIAKDDPDGEYKGDTVKFLRDVIEGLNWDKGVNKYNPKEKAITDKKRKALLKVINSLKETGSKSHAKKEEWRRTHQQLKLFDRKPKR
jgi:hypothetical protein